MFDGSMEQPRPRARILLARLVQRLFDPPARPSLSHTRTLGFLLCASAILYCGAESLLGARLVNGFVFATMSSHDGHGIPI